MTARRVWIWGVVLGLATFLAPNADATAGSRQSVGVDYGFNGYGNTLGISYKRHLVGRFDVGLGVAQGQAAIVHKSGQTLFWIQQNNTSHDLYEKARLDLLGTLFVSFSHHRDSAIALFSPIAVGLEHFVGSLSMRFEEGIPPTLYEGIRHYSGYGGFISCGLAEFHPRSTPNMFYGLGARLYLGFIRLPFWVPTWDGTGMVRRINASDPDEKGYLLFPYGELFLRIGYSF